MSQLFGTELGFEKLTLHQSVLPLPPLNRCDVCVPRPTFYLGRKNTAAVARACSLE